MSDAQNIFCQCTMQQLSLLSSDLNKPDILLLYYYCYILLLFICVSRILLSFQVCWATFWKCKINTLLPLFSSFHTPINSSILTCHSSSKVRSVCLWKINILSSTFQLVFGDDLITAILPLFNPPMKIYYTSFSVETMTSKLLGESLFNSVDSIQYLLLYFIPCFSMSIRVFTLCTLEWELDVDGSSVHCICTFNTLYM